jgi:hypothetical protein
MYSYTEQPTPPFNSPYQQHTSRTGSLLESPYPSPGRQESRPNYTHGLGLYEVNPSLPNGLPPSPQPSESWGGQYSNGNSVEPIANPYLSGAFDHPVSHSPVPWNSAQIAPPTSPPQYSPRAMSSAAYSHDGSEHGGYSDVKMEAPTWSSAVHIEYGTTVPVTMSGPSPSEQPPLTVAPDRLSTNMYSYGDAYPSPAMPRYEPASAYNYNNRTQEQTPLVNSGTMPRTTTRAPRSTRAPHMMSSPNCKQNRNPRHTDPANAAYRCELCPDRGFARRYNLKQHMLTHDAYRKKSNICPHPECRKKFVRRTDLARHDQSVHSDIRPWRCSKCSAAFPRKDTLGRSVAIQSLVGIVSLITS